MNKPLNPELVYRKKNTRQFMGNQQTAVTTNQADSCKSIAHFILSSIADKH